MTETIEAPKRVPLGNASNGRGINGVRLNGSGSPALPIEPEFLESLPPVPASEPARPAAPAVPVLRAGVRSKRGFGMGQM